MAGRKLYPRSTRVRLTDDEHRRISERAKKADQSISRYLIENALREEAMTFDEREHAEAIVFQRDWAINEVARVGNNLNQIARQLNSQRGSITSDAILTALIEVASVLNELRRLLSAGLSMNG
jgi:predicted transcriptional regulator